jgi:hypothetical protein
MSRLSRPGKPSRSGGSTGWAGAADAIAAFGERLISHAGGESPAGGMRMIEIWESEADQRKFFDENLKANLPPGLVPDLTYNELHAGFTR